MEKSHRQHQEQQGTGYLDRLAAEGLIAAQKSAKAAKLAAFAALAPALVAIAQLIVTVMK